MENEELKKTMSDSVQGWIKDKKEGRLGGKDLHGKPLLILIHKNRIRGRQH